MEKNTFQTNEIIFKEKYVRTKYHLMIVLVTHLLLQAFSIRCLIDN